LGKDSPAEQKKIPKEHRATFSGRNVNAEMAAKIEGTGGEENAD